MTIRILLAYTRTGIHNITNKYIRYWSLFFI